MLLNFTKIKILTMCCLIFLCLSSCKKLALLTGDKTALEQFFAENVLTRNFVVDYAIDDSKDITNKYKGYNFVLTKGDTYYAGVLTGTINNLTYTGTWSTTQDFEQLIINLTSSGVPPEFNFLNRTWKFTKKIPPVLQLAPTDGTDSKILYMKRL